MAMLTRHSNPMKDPQGELVRWYGTYTDIHDLVLARMKARHQRSQMAKAMDTAQVNVMLACLQTC